MPNKRDENKWIRNIREKRREEELERNRTIGKPRSKSWGGKKSPKQQRRDFKNRLKNNDFTE